MSSKNKIISVAGATSRAGKTLLAEQIIQYCASRGVPVYAVKFTTTTDIPSPCPRGTPCTVCDLSEKFRIIRDPEVLLQPGKNTQRLAAAGASEIIWIISRKSNLLQAYSHLLTHLSPDAVTVIEGSTVTSFCEPDLLFYVAANHISPSRWKDNAQEISAAADFFVLNKKKGMPDHPGLKIPAKGIDLDLQATAVTTLPEIRAAIDQVLDARKVTKV
ncbi:MAG TPA: hypothetical protein VH815_09155 [Acidobacteriota bacterium]